MKRAQVTVACARPSRDPDKPGCILRGEHVADCEGGEANPCVGCLPRPAEAGFWLCVGCQKDLAKGIAGMPGNALELHRGLAPAVRAGEGGSGSRGGSPDFARGRGVVELVCQMAHDAVWLAREVADVRGIDQPRMDAVAYPLQAVQAACRWLALHVEWMGRQKDAPHWLGMVLDARRDAFRLIDSAARQRFRLPDACPDCGSELWATTYEVGDRRANKVWCKGEDPHEWESLQWLRLGRRLGYDPSGAVG